MKTKNVRVDGDPYVILGMVGDGEFCNVFYAQRDNPREMVALKVPREGTPTFADALRREANLIRELASSSVKGTEYFSTFLPPLLETVKLTSDSWSTTANRYLWRTGFHYTFEDVLRRYPNGVDAKTAIWMWKRALSFLGWLHLAGYVHSSCTPQHLLIHPRDHGLVFAGWSRVARIGTPLVARSPGYEFYYPSDIWGGGKVTPETDIVMSARCIYRVLGGDSSNLPTSVPGELASLVVDVSQGKRIQGAWDLLRVVDNTAKKLYGGNHYHNFTMESEV